MIDWIKTIQGIAAIVTVIFATVVAWWNVGLPRLVFSPEAARGAGSPPDRGAREQLNRDTRLLVHDQACWRAAATRRLERCIHLRPEHAERIRGFIRRP
jgi:hypothetical protein